MTPLDPITRDRLIGLLTVQFTECLETWHDKPGPTRLAIVALNCLEDAPELLELLNHLAKQAIKTNNMIAIAHATLPDDDHWFEPAGHGKDHTRIQPSIFSSQAY